jgi:hypothetical protein
MRSPEQLFFWHRRQGTSVSDKNGTQLKHDWPRKFRRCKKHARNIQNKFIFHFNAAQSVSFASIFHRTIQGSITGPTKPTFVNFQAFHSVSASMEVRAEFY